MKSKSKLSLALLMLLTPALALTSCNSNPPISSSTPSEGEMDIITIAQLKENCPKDGSISSDYYIEAKIDSIEKPQFGAMTVSDSTGSISIYTTVDKTGEIGYENMTDKPTVGDIVIFLANVHEFNDVVEIKLAKIQSYKKGESYNPEDYTSCTISEARKKNKGELVKVQGTVSQITYQNGMTKNGFFLADDQSQIYIYSVVASSYVKVGDNVTVYAEKDYYINGQEIEGANKFGYKGSNQLINAYVENVASSNVNFKSAVNKTVSEVLNQSFDKDVTGLIYKSDCFVTRVQNEGENFVNYYINDFNGKDSTYFYTQNNGEDYKWVDSYVDKIQTVYYTIINAKCQLNGCNWRVVPLSIEDSSYQFDLNQATQFAYENSIVDQFNTTKYVADPNLEMITSYSNSILGINNVVITYSSNNEDAVYFENKEGKTILHTKNVGKATITINLSLDGYNPYSKTVDLEVINIDDIQSINVNQAIGQSKGQEVTVKGVVGPSLVNQTGFYLIDETGAIAVKLALKDDMKYFKQNQTVIIKGTKDEIGGKDGSPDTQICISNSTLYFNIGGNTEYSTTSFIKDKTLSELFSTEQTITSTAQVYVVKTKIYKAEGNFGQYYLEADGKQIQTYAGSSSQYGWLQTYVDSQEEVTIELSFCNWNGKAFKLCIHSVTDKSGVKVVNDLNFR